MVGVDPRRVDRYGKLAIPAVESLWVRAGEQPRKHSSPGIAFGRAQLLVFHEVAAGRAEQLPALVPDIVYLATAPFAGHEEGLRQARLAAESAAGGPRGRTRRGGRGALVTRRRRRDCRGAATGSPAPTSPARSGSGWSRRRPG